MAANFDPAFERRIRTHILFEMPDAATRARIWKVQLHRRTPLDADVNFDALGEQFDGVSGGDIKNAVLKAAQIALTEPGPDSEKRIAQRHFETAMRDVLSSKKVMEQSIYQDGDGSNALSALTSMNGAYSQLASNQGDLEENVQEIGERLLEIEGAMATLPAVIERFDEATRHSQTQLREELGGKLSELQNTLSEYSNSLRDLQIEVREALPTRLQTLEKSREEFATQLTSLPQQVESSVQEKLQVQHDTLRAEIQARNAELEKTAHSLRLSLTLSVASLAAAIIALATAILR
jgi:hypothetical protein